MRLVILLACCLLATGVLSKGIEKKEHKKSKVPVKTTKDVAGKKRDSTATPELVAVATQDNDDADADEDEPKRLVVYFNFEKVNHKKPSLISDKSGYENSGIMATGGEILKYNDPDFTCNQASRLWDSDISLKGDTFQAKPRKAITIAAWVKLEEKMGQHSIFDTIGTSHAQGQFHFEVNDGVVRWFHRDECQKVVFETMAHTVPKGKWVHLAGEYNSKTTQAKVFINGEIRNISVGSGELSRDWGVRAGIGNHEKHRPLRGAIDEFRIYNYALKPDEIKALVSACKGGGGGGGGGASAAPAAEGPEATAAAGDAAASGAPKEVENGGPVAEAGNQRSETEKAGEGDKDKAAAAAAPEAAAPAPEEKQVVETAKEKDKKVDE